MKEKIILHLLCDIPDSFLIERINELLQELNAPHVEVYFYRKFEDVPKNGILILVSAQKILTNNEITKFDHCFVVHPSRLPEGRGSAAIANCILGGKDEIWVSIFEPTEKIDQGPIYYQEGLKLAGHELLPEIRNFQFLITVKLLQQLLSDFPNFTPVVQGGKASYFKKRFPIDSEIDPNKAILEQFNLFRIVDNEKYPAFFRHENFKYVLKIYKEEEL